MSSRNTIEIFLHDKNAAIVTRQRGPGVYEGAFATVNRGALEWFGGPGIEGKWAKTTVQKITQEFFDMNTPCLAAPAQDDKIHPQNEML